MTVTGDMIWYLKSELARSAGVLIVNSRIVASIQELSVKSVGEKMFEVKQNGLNRLDIVMSGKMDAEAMKTALDELVDKSSDIDNGTMLYDVIDFHLPSLSAIGIEFMRLPSMLGLMKKFSRAAVLTDQAWLQKVSELEGLLYPGLEIKAFNRDQKEAAEAWLSS